MAESGRIRWGGDDGNNYRWNQSNFSRPWIDRWTRKSEMAMDTRLIFAPFRYFSRGNGGSEAGNERVVDESRLDESIIEGHRSYRRKRESSSSSSGDSEVKNYGAIIRVRLEPRSCRSPLVCAARFREEERVGQGR